MRPRGVGVLYGIVIVICAVLFVFGGVVPIVAYGDLWSLKWPLLSSIAIAYLVRQYTRPTPRLADPADQDSR